MLLPVIALDCWQSGDLGRAAALLVLAALLVRTNDVAALPATLACLLGLTSTKIREPLHARMLLVLAIALLALSALVLAHDIYKILPQLQTIRSQSVPYMVRMGEVQALAYGGLLPAAALALVCFSVSRVTRRNAVLLAASGAVLLLSVLPYGVLTWTHAKFPRIGSRPSPLGEMPFRRARKCCGRNRPRPNGLNSGASSYWSLYQMAGMVFSRDVTMVSTSRETAVSQPMLATVEGSAHTPRGRWPVHDHGCGILRQLDRSGAHALSACGAGRGSSADMLHLYRCSEHRH